MGITGFPGIVITRVGAVGLCIRIWILHMIEYQHPNLGMPHAQPANSHHADTAERNLSSASFLRRRGVPAQDLVGC